MLGEKRKCSVLEDEKPLLIREGSAECLFDSCVFYNKVQVLNRDLSVLFLDTVFCPSVVEGKKIRLLEAFGATGLRAIRYAHELTDKNISITVNDIDVNAVRLIEQNLLRNGCTTASSFSPQSTGVCGEEGLQTACCTGQKATCPVTVVNCEAEEHMYCSQEKYNCIDIDPYGSPSVFMHTAVKRIAISRHFPGYLMITATDASVLCGHNSGTCLARYGSVNVHGLRSCHELALRILLYSLQMSASKVSRYIEPVLSLHLDFYFRLFVRVRQSARLSKICLTNHIANIHVCQSCQWYGTVPLTTSHRLEKDPIIKAAIVSDRTSCPVCKSRIKMAGPVWTGTLHNKEIVCKMLENLKHHKNTHFQTENRMKAALDLANDEIDDGMLFFSASALCKVLCCPTIPNKSMRSALVAAGYKVSHTHCDPAAIKTNASMELIWKIICDWKRQNMCNSTHHKHTEIAQKIMDTHDSNQVFDFSFREEAQSNIPGSQHLHVNPEANWGPKKKVKRIPQNV